MVPSLSSQHTSPRPAQVGCMLRTLLRKRTGVKHDFRLSPAAYDHAKSCYDREYLFQWAEMDPNIHRQAEAQVTARIGCTAGAPGCSLNVPTEPYKPAYFLINGRSMPDLMDPNYAAEYPHQPYNGNPHMHPGELTLIRTIGQGRWQHPFHEHANHVRILARDGNLILSSDDPDEQALAGISDVQHRHDSGAGVRWNLLLHRQGVELGSVRPPSRLIADDPVATLRCTPDANGYNTGAPTAINFWEWCQDHNKPMEVNPSAMLQAAAQ